MAAIVCLAGISACADRLTIDSGLVRRLNNRGPVILSPDNPYIAGNLLLAKEMEKSEELRGFVTHRGAPAALEVEKTTFSPLTMSLYYPEKGEVYVAEQTDDGGWFIKGPDPISPSKAEEVAGGAGPIALSKAAGAVTERPGEPGEPSSAETPVTDTHETATRAGSSAPRAAGEPKVDGPVPTAGVRTLPLSETDKARAELTPKGDLVHYVTYPGETLALIAEWYTDDISNAGKLARMNSIDPSTQLTIGDTIVVPAYLVKNKNQLPEIAVSYARQHPEQYTLPGGDSPPAPRFTSPAGDIQ